MTFLTVACHAATCSCSKASQVRARLRWPCISFRRGKNGERSLYITLSETERELRQGAASHGWDLDDNIHIFELTPPKAC